MWEEEEKLQLKDTSKMIDVAFRIQCKTLPYDHAYDLSNEIIKFIASVSASNKIILPFLFSCNYHQAF